MPAGQPGVLHQSCVCVCVSVDSGQSSAVADFNLLDTARKVELYGIQMHPAKVLGSFSSEFSCMRVKLRKRKDEVGVREPA